MKRPLLTLLCVAGILAIGGAAHAQGILIPKDKSLPALAIESHRVSIKINDQGAVTSVEQVFRNHTNRQLEATYVFPLPQGAAVQEFALWMNGKKVSGEVLEAGRAKQIYTDIVRRMRDPGLLEYLGNNLFRASIYPVPPNSTQKVQIAFSQVAPMDAGLCKYVYPLKTGHGASRTLKDFTIDARVKSSIPIKSIYSPTHEIDVDRDGENVARVGVENMRAALDRDFILYYTVSEKDVGINLLAQKNSGEDGYFMLLVSPKADPKADEILPKDVSFVIDASGSMRGEKMKRAKNALNYFLDNLNKGDSFNVIRFSTGVKAFREKSVTADKKNIGDAKKFVDKMRAQGGTAIHDALARALEESPADGRPSIVIFLTDGMPTVGETSYEKITADAAEANDGRRRLFVVGVGDDVNAVLLDRLADDGRGYPLYVKPDVEIEKELGILSDRISRPVFSDISLSIPGVETDDIYPVRLPDLFAGSRLVIFGRYEKGGASAVVLNGSRKGKRESVTYEATFPKESDEAPFVPKLWATRKVGHLLGEIRLHGENRELVDEVRRLGTRYGIVTPYTSYLIVENEKMLTRNRGMNGLMDGEADMPAAAPLADGAIMGSMGKGAGDVLPTEEARVRGERAGRAKMMAQSFAEVSGAGAVTASKEIDKLKSSETMADDMTAVRTVGDKTFVYKNGAFTDTAYTGKEKVLRVKYMSDAWFAIAAKSKSAAKYLKLGKSVIFVSADGRAVIVAGDGVDKIDDEELAKWLP